MLYFNIYKMTLHNKGKIKDPLVFTVIITVL